ncbi:MAG TPA: hypothetical protein PK358_11785 [Spirochaetota bacterium]|nr:hypothetical protein [Spirochaetota bacterium]HPJ35511.1 hypothetical protein [Spirochaetota bacterium]
MKKKKIKPFIRAFMAILLVLPIFQSCDTGKSVVLSEEYVNIRVGENHTATVHVNFIFTETENFTGTLLAFPKSEWFAMKGFTATWNDKKLSHETVTAPEGKYFSIGEETCSSLYTFRVPPGSAQKSVHTISYSYTMPYVDFSKEYEAEGRYLEYILRTGSLWHGRVSKLKVTVTTERPRACDKILILNGSFEGKCTNPNTWVFEGKDIELNRNIRLIIR